jgi:NADH-quinone oxidoreductase subunit C
VSAPPYAWAARVREAYGGQLPSEVEDGFGPVRVDVPADRWAEAVQVARDDLGCTFFDWLSAVDELAGGFRVVCHLAARRPAGLDHLLVSALLPRSRPVVASVRQLFAGAAWHERETQEMFGIAFTAAGEPMPVRPLLLPAGFEGHPLRKEFVLASRVAQPWPGTKEPGESDASPRSPRLRRRARPPGVPEPGEWGSR